MPTPSLFPASDSSAAVRSAIICLLLAICLFVALPTLSAQTTPEPPLPDSPFTGTNDEWTPITRDFDGVTMVYVPAGCFRMGSDRVAAERPIHETCVETPFWLDQTEVTQAQFSRFGGRKADTNRYSGFERPVERISWFEAVAFCALRGARLPTEREWEFAARGPQSWAYPWGNDLVPANAIWNRNPAAGTAEVGSLPDGASWVGALDMSGNVAEWVSTIFRPYPYSPDMARENPRDTTSQRLVRGGSWNSSSSSSLLAADRERFSPTTRNINRGFRCARDA
jgi:formylglycine-generating enzyme required for sulfatase activity